MTCPSARATVRPFEGNRLDGGDTSIGPHAGARTRGLADPGRCPDARGRPGRPRRRLSVDRHRRDATATSVTWARQSDPRGFRAPRCSSPRSCGTTTRGSTVPSPAFDRSQSALNVGSIDLYLIHWPVRGQREESWRALGRPPERGESAGDRGEQLHRPPARSAGPGLRRDPMRRPGRVLPVPLPIRAARARRRHDIQLEAYSPLVRGARLDHPDDSGPWRRPIGRTPAQVILRWDLQHGVVPIPKSTRPERIRENAGLFDFELSPSELARLDALNEDLRMAWDPSRIG